jgi:hypothetical protein
VVEWGSDPPVAVTVMVYILADDGSAKPAPQPIVDTARPSKEMMHTKFTNTPQPFFPRRKRLAGKHKSAAANTGVVKGHSEGSFPTAACCIGVRTVIVELAPALPGVTEGGVNVTVAPLGRPLAAKVTG